MKISISNNMSHQDIESAYNIMTSNSDIDLYIPANLSNKQLGIYSEIIQLVINWGKRPKGRLYVNYAQNTDDLQEKLDTMFRRYWNFVAASMGHHKGIFLSDNVDITRFAATVVKDRIGYINKHESWRKGDTAFIASVQHSATPFPPAFYFSNGALKSKKEFVELSKNILVEISKNQSFNTSTTFIESNKQLIGEIIFELIENTHFWSQSDYSGKIFSTGIRGLIASVHRGSKDTLLKNSKDDIPFKNYLTKLFSLNESDKEIFIMEISVFDSGSGLASKYAKKNITEFNGYNEIYQTIINCLVQGNTSDNYSGYERGFGLYNIMKLLHASGFLKIRTNGLKLFRNFIDNPFNSQSIRKEDYKLEDWYKAQELSPPNYSTEGSLFTIFIPLIS